ncbi:MULTISPECIES: endonuclease/exonuclease/phosphatase family protein [Streptomyces]|uniref:Endonuclease/exonuclease/phosphatase domain-containing protein n=1 Tax=Streptomyces luteosporeus TaxID=173856 RepID=A0ABN3U015_9ACTN
MTAPGQLALLTPEALGRPPSTTHLNLITWNVQNASPDRSRSQAGWLAQQEQADVAVLTEVGAGPGGDALVQALADNGYQSIVSAEPGGDYRTVIASRLPTLEVTPPASSFLAHRAPAARLTIGEHAVGLLGLYVPSRGPKERRNENKRAFQASVTEHLAQAVDGFGGLVVVAGDLNVVEPGHRPHHKVFGAWEYAFYRAFADAGLVDAFRTLHPDAVEHSWFGRSSGYRFDHAFVSAAHRDQITACSYLHDVRRAGLSDHSAMTLTVVL